MKYYLSSMCVKHQRVTYTKMTDFGKWQISPDLVLGLIQVLQCLPPVSMEANKGLALLFGLGGPNSGVHECTAEPDFLHDIRVGVCIAGQGLRVGRKWYLGDAALLRLATSPRYSLTATWESDPGTCRTEPCTVSEQPSLYWGRHPLRWQGSEVCLHLLQLLGLHGGALQHLALIASGVAFITSSFPLRLNVGCSI